MALSPFTIQTTNTEDTETEQVTRTYRLNFDTGKIDGIIDGKDALKQAIYKAIITARFRFPIYTDQYGCELEDLIGADIPTELFEVEVKRVIKDALIYIDEVNEVTDFNIQREGDGVFISFKVDTIYGEIGEVVNI